MTMVVLARKTPEPVPMDATEAEPLSQEHATQQPPVNSTAPIRDHSPEKDDEGFEESDGESYECVMASLKNLALKSKELLVEEALRIADLDARREKIELENYEDVLACNDVFRSVLGSEAVREPKPVRIRAKKPVITSLSASRLKIERAATQMSKNSSVMKEGSGVPGVDRVATPKSASGAAKDDEFFIDEEFFDEQEIAEIMADVEAALGRNRNNSTTPRVIASNEPVDGVVRGSVVKSGSSPKIPNMTSTPFVPPRGAKGLASQKRGKMLLLVDSPIAGSPRAQSVREVFNKRNSWIYFCSNSKYLHCG